MVLRRSSSGPQVVPKKFLNGSREVLKAFSNCHHMVPKWSSSCFQMVPMWSSGGPQEVLKWFSNKAPSGSQVAFWWISSGSHIVPKRFDSFGFPCGPRRSGTPWRALRRSPALWDAFRLFWSALEMSSDGLEGSRALL